MKRANLEDKKLVVGILTDAYRNDPHVNYLLEKSRNKNKLRIVMEYIFDLSYNKGEIYLNEDETAVALWDTSRKNKFSFKKLFQEVYIALQLGIDTTLRILKMNQLLEMNLPRKGEFARLYTLGVSNKGKGKGYAKKMIDFMAEKMSKTKATLYVDTISGSKIGTFNKSGFHLFKAIDFDNQKLYFLNRVC
jgi:hypothetical protein